MGGSDGTIIVKNLKAAAQLSMTASGRVKLWHVLVATHLLAWWLG